MRVNKYLAQCGIGSRRSVEKTILSGRVKVNGVAVKNLATDISKTDTVTVDGRPLKPQTEKIYIMLNKPVGTVTTANDPFDRKTVLDVIYENPKQYRKLLESVRLYPVGRLDYNTGGLLLLTNDGELTAELTHPSSNICKTYIAVTDRRVTEPELETLSAGVKVDGRLTSPAVFEYADRGGTDRTPDKRCIIKITLHEGRNRQIRKMFETLSVSIKSLTRIAEGKLTIGNLKTGDWKFIRKSQIL
jgi:23S rRNA pseudouridine2605 synthase